MEVVWGILIACGLIFIAGTVRQLGRLIGIRLPERRPAVASPLRIGARHQNPDPNRVESLTLPPLVLSGRSRRSVRFKKP